MYINFYPLRSFVSMKLTVQKRTVKGKALAKLRKQDIMPAIVYAKHLDEPIMVQCRRQDFVKAYKEGGRSTVITLEGDGVKQDVLIQDINIDPITHNATHADFIAVKAGQAIEAEVSLTLVGKAPVITSSEISLQQLRDTVAIKAKPKDLPNHIEINVSIIENQDDVIYVKDLVLPKGVEVLEEEEVALVIVSVANAGDTEETETDTEETTTEETAE